MCKKANKLGSKQVGMLVGQMIMVVIGMLTIIVVARKLGLEAFGRVGLVAALISVIAVIQQFGIGATFNRQLALKDKKYNQAILLTNIFIFRLVLLVPVILLVIFFSEELVSGIYGRKDLVNILRIGVLALFFSELYLIVDTFLIGTNHTSVSINLNVLISVIRLLAFFFTPTFSEEYYFFVIAMSSLFGLFVFILVYLFDLKRSFYHTNLKSLNATFNLIWAMSLTSSGTKIVYAVWDKLPVLLAANFVNDAIIGQLQLAVRLAEKFRGIGAALSKVNMAHMTSKLFKDGVVSVNDSFRENHLLLTLVFSIIVSSVYFLDSFIINVVGGVEFEGAADYLIYTITISFIFLQINWIGSGVLYPFDNIKGLGLFHFLTKTVTFLLVLCAFYLYQSIEILLLMIIVTECISILYYNFKSNCIGVYPIGRGVLCCYVY